MKKTIITTMALAFSLLTVPVQAIDRGDPERGKELSATCAACHGPDGNGTVPEFPRIAGQYADYLVHSMKAYKTGERTNPVMVGIVAGLSEQDMQDLAAFFSRQKGDLYNKSIGGF